MSRKVRMVLCWAITALLVAVFAAASTRVWINFGTNYVSCTSMMYKSAHVKNLLDTVFFYLVPALISLTLYSVTGYRLMGASRNRKLRNRNLTIALIFSTVFWIICWAPQSYYYLYSTYAIGEKDFGWKIYKQDLGFFVLEEMKTSLVMSHAYVSPLLILFISRKFQEPFRRWWHKYVASKIWGAEKTYIGPMPSTSAGSTNGTSADTEIKKN
ncbi:neuromedin-B receptor-like [Symsagittifera roscoffensis]|uniref:neuromedin-B receptor-like n=1 Tax=Symsagittifera roscoffensis TaxID=84072 RepID=UPI00307C5D13